MRRGGIYAVLALGIVGLVTTLGVVLTRPSARALVASFFAPLPPPPSLSRDAGVAQIPVEPLSLGVESPELATLGGADAGAPAPRTRRLSIFPVDGPGAGERPAGIPRTPLTSREDEGVNACLGYLARNEAARDAIRRAVKRSGRCRADVERILHAWKLPDDLLAVVFVESAFTPSGSARDGSAGLWSLPSDVALAYGLVVSPSFDERRSVEVSTEGAAHYLADLRDRLGSWELALYAFGTTYGATLAALRDKTQADFWKLARDLSPDGVAYVRQVLALATALGNLDRFGLGDVQLDEHASTSDLEVPAGTSFATVARAAGTTKERLHDLNPEYLGETVPNTGFAMVMHVPSAGLARARELLMPLLYATTGSALSRSVPTAAHDLDGSVEAGRPTAASALRPGRDGRFFVRVQDGDTLDALAARFHTDKDTIALDNALDSTASLRVGQLLTIRPPSEGDSPHVSP